MACFLCEMLGTWDKAEAMVEERDWSCLGEFLSENEPWFRLGSKQRYADASDSRFLGEVGILSVIQGQCSLLRALLYFLVPPFAIIHSRYGYITSLTYTWIIQYM